MAEKKKKYNVAYQRALENREKVKPTESMESSAKKTEQQQAANVRTVANGLSKVGVLKDSSGKKISNSTINAATTTKKKWYSGSQPTTREAVARIYELADDDPERLSELQQKYDQEIADKGSIFYNPYTKATNTKAIEGLTELGYDVSDVDSFLANNKWLMNYARETTTGYGAHAPTKSSSDLQDAAYWYSELYEAQERTTAAQTEMSQLASDIGYLVERGYSDDAIIAMTKKDFSSNYGTLAKMDDNRLAGEASILNKAVNYNGDDTLYGMIWAARNDDTSGDYFADSVKYTMGIGNKYVYDANSEAARDPSNYEQYNPYAMGSNLTEWNKRTGSTKIDDTTLETWREQMLSVGASDEDQKLWQSAYEANENTKAAQSELSTLDTFVEEQYAKGRSADDICAMVTAMIDPEDGKVDSDYTTLGKMESKRKMGSYLSMGDTVDFTLPTYLQKIRSMEGTVEQAEVDPSTVASDYENYNPYTSYVVDGWADAAGGEAMTREYLDAHREWLDDENLAKVWRKADTALDNGDKANAELEELDGWLANKVKRGWSAEKIVGALDEELSSYTTLSNMEEARERGEAYAVAGADFTKPAYIKKIYEMTGEEMPEAETETAEEQVAGETAESTQEQVDTTKSVDWFFGNAKKDKTLDEYMEDNFGVGVTSFSDSEKKQWAKVRNAVQAAKVTNSNQEEAEEQAAAFAEQMAKVAQSDRAVTLDEKAKLDEEAAAKEKADAEAAKEAEAAEEAAAAEAKANAYKDSAAYLTVYSTGEEAREGMAQGETTPQAAKTGDEEALQQGSQNPTAKSEESAAYMTMCQAGQWDTQAFDWAKQNSTNWNAVETEMYANIAAIRKGDLAVEDAGLAGSWWNEFGFMFSSEDETWEATNSVMGASRRLYDPRDNYGTTLGGFIKDTVAAYNDGDGDLDRDEFYELMVDASRYVDLVNGIAGDDLSAETAESIVDGSRWSESVEQGGDQMQLQQSTMADKINALAEKRDNSIADNQRAETEAMQTQYKQNRASLDKSLADGRTPWYENGEATGTALGADDKTYKSISEELLTSLDWNTLADEGYLPKMDDSVYTDESRYQYESNVRATYVGMLESRANAILANDMLIASSCGMTLDEYYKAYPDQAKTGKGLKEQAIRDFNEAYGQDLQKGAVEIQELEAALNQKEADETPEEERASRQTNSEMQKTLASINADKQAAEAAGQTLLEYYNEHPDRKEEVAKLSGYPKKDEETAAAEQEEAKSEAVPMSSEFGSDEKLKGALASIKAAETTEVNPYADFDAFLTENADKLRYTDYFGTYDENGEYKSKFRLFGSTQFDPLESAIFATKGDQVSIGEDVVHGVDQAGRGLLGSIQKAVYNFITLDPNDTGTQESIRRSYDGDAAAYKQDIVDAVNKYYPDGEEKEAMLAVIDNAENIWSVGMNVGSVKWKGRVKTTEADQQAIDAMIKQYGSANDVMIYEATQSSASSAALMLSTQGMSMLTVPAFGEKLGGMLASVAAAFTEGADMTYSLRESGVDWNLAAGAGFLNQVISGMTEYGMDIEYKGSAKVKYALDEKLKDGVWKAIRTDPKGLVSSLIDMGKVLLVNEVGEVSQELTQNAASNTITRMANGESLADALLAHPEDIQEAGETAWMTLINGLVLSGMTAGYTYDPVYLNERSDAIDYATAHLDPAYDGNIVNYVIEKNATTTAIDYASDQIIELANSPAAQAAKQASEAVKTATEAQTAAQKVLQSAKTDETVAATNVSSAAHIIEGAETVTADMTKNLTDANKALTDATQRRVDAEAKLQEANDALAKAQAEFDESNGKVAAEYARIINAAKQQGRKVATEQFFADATPEQRAAFEEYLAACTELGQAKSALAAAKQVMEKFSQIAANNPGSRKARAAVTTYGRMLTKVDELTARVSQLNDKVNALYESDVAALDKSGILKEGESQQTQTVEESTEQATEEATEEAANEITDDTVNDAVNDAVNEETTEQTEEVAEEAAEQAEPAAEEATEETTEEEPTEFSAEEVGLEEEETEDAEAEAETEEEPKAKTAAEKNAEDAVKEAEADPVNARKQREADIATKVQRAEAAEAELNARMPEITQGLMSRDRAKRSAAVTLYQELSANAKNARGAANATMQQENKTSAAQIELREAISELSKFSNRALAYEGHPDHEAAVQAYERVEAALYASDVADARNKLSSIANELDSEDPDSAKKYLEANQALEELLKAQDSWTGETSKRRSAAVMEALRQGGHADIVTAMANRESRDDVSATLKEIVNSNPDNLKIIKNIAGIRDTTVKLTIKDDTGATGNAGVTRAYAESTTSLTKDQSKQLDILDMLGKDIGVEIVVHPTVSNVAGAVNGAYLSGNVVHVGLDALDQGYVQAGFHEVTHWIAKNNSEAFKGLAAVVTEALEANGADVQALVANRIEQYASRGEQISSKAALEEIVAESCGLVLTDEQNMKTFAQEHKGAFKNVMQRFAQFWKKLTNTAKSIAGKNRRGEMEALIGKGSDLQKIYDNFMKAAKETGLLTQETKSEDVDSVVEQLENAAETIEENAPAERTPEQMEMEKAMEGIDEQAARDYGFMDDANEEPDINQVLMDDAAVDVEGMESSEAARTDGAPIDVNATQENTQKSKLPSITAILKAGQQKVGKMKKNGRDKASGKYLYADEINFYQECRRLIGDATNDFRENGYKGSGQYTGLSFQTDEFSADLAAQIRGYNINTGDYGVSVDTTLGLHTLTIESPESLKRLGNYLFNMDGQGLDERNLGDDLFQSKGSYSLNELASTPDEAQAIATNVHETPASEMKYSLNFDEQLANMANDKNQELGLVDQNVLDEANSFRKVIADYMKDHFNALRLPSEPAELRTDKAYDTIVKNASYGYTIENSLLCPRTIVLESLVDQVADTLGRPLTVAEQTYICQEIVGQAQIKEPQCIYCYVAMDRMAYRETLGTYIKWRDGILEEYRKDPAKYAEGTKAREALYKKYLKDYSKAGRKHNDTLKERFDTWLANEDAGVQTITAADLANVEKLQQLAEGKFEGIKAGDAPLTQVVQDAANYAAQLKNAMSYAQSASYQKSRTKYKAYNGSVLRMSQEMVDDLNEHYGGLRAYSFSDASPAYILENIQMVNDMAVRGLKGFGYTKVPWWARIFATTGMNINVSVFGMMDGKGNVVEDSFMGASWAETQQLRSQYENVGAVFVATNDEMVDWALDQDWIDVVIPMHMVKTGATVMELLGFNNYSSQQGDKKVKGKWQKGVDEKEIGPGEHMNDKKTYLELLEKNHLTPRFKKWLNNDNYMKLVNETRMPLTNAQPVRPVTNQMVQIPLEGGGLGEMTMEAYIKLQLDNMANNGGFLPPIGGSDAKQLEHAGTLVEKLTKPDYTDDHGGKSYQTWLETPAGQRYMPKQQEEQSASLSLNTGVLEQQDLDTAVNYITDQLVNNGPRAVEIAKALSQIDGGNRAINIARDAAKARSDDNGQRIAYLKTGDKQAAPGVTGIDRTAANQAKYVSPTTGEVLQDVPAGEVTNPVQILRELTDSIRIGLNPGGQMAASGTQRMPSGVMGFYDRIARSITSRTTEASDLSVGLHEFGHAVQDRLTNIANPTGGMGLTANQAMLDALPQGFTANYAQHELDGEAVAEFVCDYMYDRDLAVQRAGEDYVKNFEKMLRSDPDLLSAMNKARDQVTIWANASTEEKVKAMVSETSTTQKRRHGLKRILNDINRAIFDSTAPASLVSENLRQAAQWSSFSAKRAGMIMTDRLIDPQGNTIGDSLATRWAKLGVDESMREDIEAYALARHALDRDAQGRPVFDRHEITNDELANYIAGVEQQHPEIVRAADALTEFWNDFFDAWFVQTGMVSEDAVKEMRKMYPHYVPTYRVQDRNMSTGSNVRSTFTLRAARGSSLEVISPIASITNMVQQVVKTVSQNEVMRQFHHEMQQGDYGWLATQETQDFAYTRVNTQNAEEALTGLTDALGISGTPLQEVQDLYDAIVSLQDQYRATGQNYGRNVVSGVDENGTRFFYKINDDYQGLYELLSGTGDAQLTGKFWNTVRKLKNGFTQLTTAKNPFFLPKNIIRDMQASVNTGTWAVTYADGMVKWVQSFYDVVTNSEDFQEYINMGGGEYTRFSNDTQENVKKLMGALFTNNQKVTPKKVLQTAANVMTLSQLNEIAEATSRYAEYKHGKHDRSTFEGRREAFMAAQNVTTNFGAHGASTAAKIANTVIPFCNATLQGLAKDINIIADAFDKDGNVRKQSWTTIGKTILNVGLTAALQAALVGAFGGDDDDDETAKEYGLGSLSLRTENFLIPTGSDVTPFIRIPIEQGPLARMVYGVSLGLMSDVSGMDELSVDLYAMGQNIIRDTLPDGSIAQGLRDASNNTTYYGRQIVSDYTGKRSAPNQYNSDTLDVFKKASSALYSLGVEVSPAVMQYAAEQYSGVLGKFIIPALSGNKYTGDRSIAQSLRNIGEAALKNFTADPVTYSDTQSNYSSAKEIATAIRYDYQNGDTVYNLSSKLDEYEIEEAVDEATKMNKKGGIFYDADAEISDLWDEISEIQQATVLTDSEKAVQIRGIRKEMSDIMINALEEWSIYKMYYIDHDDLAIEATERIKKGMN